MSDERRHYESIRRKANLARERLTDTLAQSRIATARDKRAKERGAVRGSFVTRLGGERNVTRFGKRTHQFGEDRQVGVHPDTIQSPDAER